MPEFYFHVNSPESPVDKAMITTGDDEGPDVAEAALRAALTAHCKDLKIDISVERWNITRAPDGITVN